MHLYFNHNEYYRTLFTVTVAIIGTLTMLSVAVAALVTTNPEPMSGLVYVSVTAAFITGLIALMNLPRLRTLYTVRSTINSLMELLEDYTSGLESDAEVIFPGTDGFMIEAKRRSSGAFRLAIARDGGMRHMVVQRYRVDEGTEVGTLMALSELRFLQSITRFIQVHAEMADRTSTNTSSEVSKVQGMMTRSDA